MPGRKNLFSNLKYKAQTAMSRFLYEERGSGYGSGVYMDEEPPYQPEERPRRTRRMDRRAEEEPQAEPAWQAPYQGSYPTQQPLYQQQPQTQPQAQQPQPQPMTQFAAQMEEQRSRARQDGQNVVPFPGAYSAEQQPAAEQPTQMGVCVLNLRNNTDCRLAISMLRQGNALMVIMENVGDAAEMRRYVDTLSGACFSLNATITKVSRHGAYLLAPGTVAVMADAVTSQMNSAPRRAQAAAPRTQTRPANPAAYPPQAAYAPSYQNPVDENGFEYRAPSPEPQQAAFYYRQPQPAPAAPAFESQRPGAGYVPDQYEAVSGV